MADDQSASTTNNNADEPKPAAINTTGQGSSTSQTMHVKVYAQFKTYFDDTAYSISAVNATGPFDILPRHHNFMTLLSEGDIVVRYNGGENRFDIQRGIMHVKADEVIVFLDV